jgi:hypothetical protein
MLTDVAKKDGGEWKEVGDVQLCSKYGVEGLVTRLKYEADVA